MSRSRLILRTLLVLLLLGVCWVAGVAWFSSQSGGYMAKAESAIDSGDLPAARIHLMNLLNKEPENGRAHELMGKLLLAEAKETPGTPTTYVANADARTHLKKAAQLQQDNLPLQKQLLEVFLSRGSMAAAAEVAAVVHAVEPSYADAVLALGVEDIRVGRPADGEAKIEQYLTTPTTHVFRGYQAALVLHKGEDQAEQRDKLFDRTAASAANLTTESLAALPLDEQLLMSGLLQASIADAPNSAKAHQRVAATLSVSQKVAQASGNQAPQLAQLIASTMNRLSAKYPTSDLAADDLAERRTLEAQSKQMLSGFVTAGVPVPLVYLQAAEAARDARDYEQAQQLLQAGIKACAKLPADRSTEVETLHLMAARNLIMMRRYNDAAQHLELLIASDDDNIAGWGELLTGGVASAEGRHGAALRSYQRAQGKLGRTAFVEVALAKTYLRLGNFAEALPRLKALQQVLDTSDPEQQSWAQLHGVVRDQVAWDEFRGNLALGQWEEAEAKLAALADTPFGPRAEALAAGYLLRQDRASDAQERVATAAARYPDSVSLRNAQIALLYADKKQAEAEQAIDTLAANADLPSQLMAAHWRMRQGRSDEALSMLDRAATQHPESAAPDVLKARILLVAGKPREALAVAQKLKASPKSAAAGKVVELLEALDQQDFDRASDQLTALSSQASTVTPAMSLLAGSIAAAKGDLQSAVEQVGNSLDVTSLDQHSHRTLLKAILMLEAKEGTVAATAALDPLLAEYPHNPFLHVVHADLLMKQGLLDEGRAALDQAERELPASPVIPYLKAATWASVGDAEQALGEANRALAITDTYEPARLLAAKLQLATGKPARALATATKVIADSPRQWSAYFVKAEAERQSGRLPDAVKTLTAAVNAEPRLVPAYRGLMSLLLGAGRGSDALKVCQQGRKSLPDEVAFVLDEITVQTQLENVDEATQLAEQFVTGEHPAGYSKAVRAIAVAQTFASAGKRDLATEWAKRGLTNATGNEKATAQLFLGELALATGQTTGDRAKLAEARDYFASVVQQHPQHAVAGNNLAWLLATEFNEPARAVTIAEQLRGDAPATALPAGFIDTLAVVYRAAGENQKARELLEQALEVYPDQSAFMYHLGFVLADSGQSTAAVNLLERAISVGGLTEQQQTEAKEMLDKLAEARRAPTNATSTP